MGRPETTGRRPAPPPYRWLPGLIGLMTATALAIGGLAFAYLESRLVASTGTSLKLLATDVAALLDRVLFERYGDIRMMTHALPDKMKDPAGLTRYLASMQEHYLVYRFLGVTDAGGRLLASTDPAAVGTDQSHEPWFTASRDGAGVVLEDVPAPLEAGPTRTIRLSAPIRGSRGELLGVVTARVGLAELEGLITQTVGVFRQQQGAGGRVEWQLLAADGRLLADSILHEESGLNLKDIGVSSASLAAQAEPGFIEETHPRRRLAVVTGYARTQGYGEFTGFHWGILARMDRSDILQPIRRVLLALGTVGALLFLPMLALLLWTTRRLRQEWAKTADQYVRLKGIHTVSQALEQETTGPHTAFDLIQFLQLLVDIATRITGAQYGAFGLFDETGKQLVRFLTTGMDESVQRRIGLTPTGGGLLGFLAQGEGVLRLKDLTQHPTFSGFPAHHPHMQSFMGVSVRAHGKLLGRLYLTEKVGGPEFTELDEEVLATLAAEAGVAIENGYFLNQIRSAEALYRSTMAALPVSVIRLASDKRVKFANQAFYELSQRTESEVLHQPIDGLLPIEGLGDLLGQVRAGDRSITREYRVAGPAPHHWRIIASAMPTEEEIILVIKDITDLKLAEQEASRVTQDRLLLLDSTGEGIFGIDLEARCTFLNRAGAAMLGYAPDEVLGRNMHELIHHSRPDGSPYPPGECPILHACRTGQGYYLDGELLWRRDGSSFAAEFSAHPIVNEERILGSVVVFADVTERRRASELLQESEMRLRAILDYSPGLIFLKDPDGRYLQVNPQFEKVFNLTREAILGKTDADLFPAEQATAFRANDLRVLLAGAAMEFEETAQYADGPHTSIVYKFPLRSADGKIYALCGIAVDVTERQRHERALRSLVEGTAHSVGGEFFRSLVQHLAAALDVRYAVVGEFVEGAVDRVRTIAVWGGSGFLDNFDYAIAGLPCEAVLEAEQWFYPGGLQARFPHAPLFAQLGAESYLGTRLMDSTGRTVGLLVVMHTAPLPDNTLAPSLLRIFAARAAAELERQRAEAALRASEDQLRQAQKMEAVGRLAGGIAHDFNNLLMVMNWHSDMLLRKLDADSPLRRHPVEIKQAGDRAAALTHQLLAFSRRQVLAPQVLDLNDCVTTVHTMLARLIGEHIQVVACLDPDLHQVRADRGQIEQVIMNLMVNARDAMPDGGMLTLRTGNIHIEALLFSSFADIEPGDYVMLAVSDTGHGMSAETQAHIFEPFFTTKELGKGTGLGLASVYGIVRQSGGCIEVHSELGQGSTFTVYLPRTRLPVELKPGTEPPPPEDLAGRSETILLVEDEPTVRLLMREVLQEAGYQVLDAANGLEALALIERHGAAIQLLLTDLVMPLMSGRELASRVAQQQPGLKTLYMSGYTDDMLTTGRPDDDLPILSKPVPPDLLLRRLRDLLDHRG